MRWIRNVAHEIFGLFVDDGSFALAVLVWLGLVWFLLARMRMAIPGGLVFFLGLAAILVESVTRFARRPRKMF
jgi:hypothetical protein